MKNPIVTSVRLFVGPAHDEIRVWNRGGLAGVLVVTSGDGGTIAQRLAEVGGLDGYEIEIRRRETAR